MEDLRGIWRLGAEDRVRRGMAFGSKDSPSGRDLVSDASRRMGSKVFEARMISMSPEVQDSADRETWMQRCGLLVVCRICIMIIMDDKDTSLVRARTAGTCAEFRKVVHSFVSHCRCCRKYMDSCWQWGGGLGKIDCVERLEVELFWRSGHSWRCLAVSAEVEVREMCNERYHIIDWDSASQFKVAKRSRQTISPLSALTE